MSTILFLLLTICKFNSLRCEISDTPGMLANTIDDYDAPANVDITAKIDSDGYLPDPISSINIDYANNALILHFRKNNQNVDGDDKRRSLLDKNFMRFGRSNSGSLMRFGKRQAESLEAEPEFRFGRDENGARDSRGDNFMRFGRSQGSLMRFGRADANVGPFGGASANRIKMSRQPLQNPMRFGRNSDRNLMRFGRGTDSSLMRFGRPDKSFMRFGRNNENLMRFGRPDSFMPISRLPKEYNDYLNDQMFKIAGRSDPYVMRFGRTDKNFMRFGKLDQNFMRFGKRDSELQNKTLEHGVSISSPKEDSLDSLWKTDESSQSEQESHAVNEDKNENLIPGFLMAQ